MDTIHNTKLAEDYKQQQHCETHPLPNLPEPDPNRPEHGRRTDPNMLCISPRFLQGSADIQTLRRADSALSPALARPAGSSVAQSHVSFRRDHMARRDTRRPL